MHPLFVRGVTRFGASLTLLAASAPALLAQGPSPFQKLRAIEQTFPRVALDTVEVGTFDVSTGKFAGTVSTPAKRVCELGPNGKPVCSIEKEELPVLVARARKVDLLFRVVNAQGTITATANGTAASAPPSAGSVVVPVTGNPAPGDTAHSRWNVKWRVASSGKSYADSLIIDRMSFGLGAFTIPVLPVAIIYDPPQDNLRENTETYASSVTYGTNVTLSLSSQSGFTGETSTMFSPFVDFYSGLKQTGQAASMIPALKAVGTVLSTAASVLPQIFGTASATQQDATTQVSGSTHSLSIMTKQSYKTARLGPGKGDVFVFYKNFHVAWLSRCCVPLLLTPLGADLLGSNTVGELKADLDSIRTGRRSLGMHSHLDSLSIQGLLALDPFVAGGNSAALSTQRFDSLTPSYSLSSLPVPFGWSITETNTQRLGTTKLSQRLEKDDAGLLGPLGLGYGPDSSGTITASITQSNLTETSVQQAWNVDVLLGGPGLDTNVVNGFYDRVFGTVAVRIIPSGPDVVAGDIATDSSASVASAQTAQPALAGAIRPAGSTPPGVIQSTANKLPAATAARLSIAPNSVAGRIVTLSVANRMYRATTDSRGHYVFRIQHNAVPVEATVALDRGGPIQRIVLNGPRIAVPPMRLR